MDGTMLRIVCAVFAVILLGVIIVRRRKQPE
jgi:hypothetical protein